MITLQTTSEAEPISADRPDIGASASTIDEGGLQLESGVSFSREGGQYSTSFPTLLRFGLSSRWELRLESELLTLRRAGLNSFSDVNLGTKINFYDRGSTKLGALLSLNIPMGPKPTRGTLDPQLVFLWDQELSDSWSFEGNLGASLSKNDLGARFGKLSYSGSLSRAITKSVAAYVELSGFGPDNTTGRYFTALDGGLTFQVSDNFQLDVYYLKGLSSFGLDWQLGSGMSLRF